MDGRYPVPSGHRRFESLNNHSPHLTPHLPQQWSTEIPTETNTSLLRSKSDMDMSRLPRMASSSQLSITPLSSKSEYFPSTKEERQGGMKSLLSRSSKLLHKRKSSNKLKSTDWTDNDGFTLAQDVLHRKLRSRHMTSPHLDSSFRPYISDPYNFRHLTHTGPVQAKALQDANPNQLISEFSAIRASQAPKPELKGIKAEDIIAQYAADEYSPTTSRSPSPPQSPNASHKLRSVQSVDSFTRVKSHSFSSPHPPISPPPRRSSRQAVRYSQGLLLTEINTALASDAPATKLKLSPKSHYSKKSISAEDSLAPCEEIAQAVTTPDNSAQLFITHQRTLSTAALADVPEEEEEAARLERTESRIRELRHAKSFPTKAFLHQESTKADFMTPQFGEEDIPARNSRRISNSFLQANWEDDIDYCYEHAMEAFGLECEEEDAWNNNSIQAKFGPGSTNPYSGSFFISSGNTNSDSATSSSVSVPGLVTPSDAAPARDSFSTSHSLLFAPSTSLAAKEINSPPPTEDQCQKLVDIEGAKVDTISCAPTTSTDYSPRNSGISKWSSRESLSTRTTSVTTGSGFSKHRQSSSIGSTPDLLPYGMSKRPKSTEEETVPFPRTNSSDCVAQNLISTLPPPPPPIITTRSRANSESTGKLLDLSMIGAPSPIISSRARAGSIASTKGRQTGATQGRVSYNLFPNTNMASQPR